MAWTYWTKRYIIRIVGRSPRSPVYHTYQSFSRAAQVANVYFHLGERAYVHPVLMDRWGRINWS